MEHKKIVDSAIQKEVEQEKIRFGLGDHFSVISINDKLYSCGKNDFGQLGIGSFEDATLPIQVKISDSHTKIDVKKIACGTEHVMLLTNSGNLYGWGNNYYDLLGFSSSTEFDTSVPVYISKIVFHKPFKSISSGSRHNLAIDNDGRLYSWGDNKMSQILGSSNQKVSTIKEIQINQERAVFINANWNHSSYLSEECYFSSWGRNYANISINRDLLFLKISSGYHHTIGILVDGRVISWGNNSSGQLGNGTFEDSLLPIEITDKFQLSESESILDVCCGESHNLALTSRNRIFSWGSNFSGQLGNTSYRLSNVPIEITSYFFLESDEKITSISSGKYHNFVSTSNNRVFSFGDNYKGELGNGTLEDRCIPTDITCNFK